MHPEQGIVHTYICPDGLSMKQNYPNTLSHQYATTNNSPRDPLYNPLTYPSNELHQLLKMTEMTMVINLEVLSGVRPVSGLDVMKLSIPKKND